MHPVALPPPHHPKKALRACDGQPMLPKMWLVTLCYMVSFLSFSSIRKDWESNVTCVTKARPHIFVFTFSQPHQDQLTFGGRSVAPARRQPARSPISCCTASRAFA